MEVILLQKVANLGNIGDRVKVKSGYGRNFLLPEGKATLATPANVARFEARRAELEKTAARAPGRRRGSRRGPRRISSSPSRQGGQRRQAVRLHRHHRHRRGRHGAGHPVKRSEVRLPAGPLRSVGEHGDTCTCTPTSNVALPVTIVAEEQA